MVTLNIIKEVAQMERMTVDELRARFAEVFGEPTNGRHKQWLIKRIAWRMQANAEGRLSERAGRRAMELANEADVRVMAPKAKKSDPSTNGSHTRKSKTDFGGDDRLPLPGTILTRTYKGQTVHVTVRSNGFEYEGELFKSLCAVTKEITGSHWNGYHFFGLRKKGTVK